MVTGAASGIGQATAVEFVGNGADAVVSDLNPGPEMKVVYSFKRFALFPYNGFNRMM